MDAEARQAAAAEEDIATLHTALTQARTALAPVERTQPARPAESISQETVESRYRRARELARVGDPAEALRELLWCYDVGMIAQSSYAGVRASFVLDEIKRLGARLPAALTALRERRDRAHQRILAGGDAEIADFVDLNRTLGEEPLTLRVYDQIPATERRKQTFSNFASELLLAERRYADVLLGQPYGMMSANFDRDITEVPGVTSIREDLRRERAIGTVVKSIEALAGAGQLDQARTLTRRLLAYDDTAGTRALLQQHAGRAGQPDLLTTLAAPPSHAAK